MGQKTNINSLRNFINASETQNTGKQTFINNSILTYLKHILKKRLRKIKKTLF